MVEITGGMEVKVEMTSGNDTFKEKVEIEANVEEVKGGSWKLWR